MRRAGMLLVTGLLAGCSSEESGGPNGTNDAGSDTAVDMAVDAPVFAPSDKRLLSADNPDHLDEDPSVILAADGSLLVAYFSNRDSNPDIYVKRSTDGEIWTEARVTTSPHADYYGNLYQDPAGTVHAVWFRWTAFELGSIWHNSSPNGIDWDPTAETQITQLPDVDDWVPTIAGTSAGDLIVTFASKKRNPAALSELYLSRRAAGASSWDAAVALDDVNDAAAHDTLPFVARTGSELTLLFVRTDASTGVPWETASADIYASSSSDGLSWSAAALVTDDSPQSFVDVFPGMYPDLLGNWSMLWISSKTGAGDTYVMPLAELTGYPAAAKVNPIFEGYSPRAAPTPTPGVFIGVWVEADPVDQNKKDVFYRFFTE